MTGVPLHFLSDVFHAILHNNFLLVFVSDISGASRGVETPFFLRTPMKLFLMTFGNLLLLYCPYPVEEGMILRSSCPARYVVVLLKTKILTPLRVLVACNPISSKPSRHNVGDVALTSQIQICGYFQLFKDPLSLKSGGWRRSSAQRSQDLLSSFHT